MEDIKENVDNKRQCVICGDNIEFYSIGQCNHNNMCYYCTLKERTFYNNRKCPLCNTILDIVFISPISETKTFEELSKEELSSYYRDNDSDEIGVYYTDISSLEVSMQLKSYKCPIDYCVKEEPFDTYEDLLHHLWDNHQKFYCKVCVKDGKKFISEQKVFSKDEIKEHNLYGDIDEDIPPHTKCPFCGDLYYNDEFLYKHMSNSHFMCEICKSMDKTIIFYSALPNLIQHNKLYHYCCPFKECQDVLYIAFFTRKQLIQHFESKHNQKNNNLNEKMADENKPKITEDPTLYDVSMKKDEFNFTNFLEKLNKRCIQHRENKNKVINEENSNNIENNNNTNFPKLNMDGVEIIYKYPKYENYNGGETNGYEAKDYYRGWGRGRGRGRKTRGNGMWNNNYGIKQNFNTYVEPEDNKFGNEIKIKELDYEFLLNFFVDLFKKYIINYIKKNKILENEISLPKETQFQLIMIIDKINDKKKILELYNIQNFGIDWDTINILKDYLIRGDQVNENDLYKELDLLPLKNILIIYQYLLISYKKISGKYYKLEMEQINENFYKNFFPDSQKNKNNNKLNGYNRPYSSIALSHELNSNNNNNNKNDKKKKNKNKKWNQMNKNIIGLNKGNNDKKPEKKEKSEIQMKKEFDKYIKQCKKEDEKLEKEKQINNKNNNEKKSDNKSKLAMLIGSDDKNKNTNKKVNKPKNTGEFKFSYFNMEEDFPPLK